MKARKMLLFMVYVSCDHVYWKQIKTERLKFILHSLYNVLYRIEYVNFFFLLSVASQHVIGAWQSVVYQREYVIHVT